MTVISVPLRLRILASTFFLSIPLIAIEVLIVSRAPVWNLPYRRALYWAMSYGLITFPLVSWILAGKRLAYLISVLLASFWVLTSASVALRMNYPVLGFFTVGLFGLLCFQFYWLSIELGRSFFDPELNWYQGLPSMIPGLVCHLGNGDRQVELKVSRMDRDGAFVFCKSTEVEKVQIVLGLIQHSRLSASFGFRSRIIQCFSRPILMADRGMGIGIQFVQMSADSRKEVGDFVEALRGEGYV
jgi:hypothetical protein